MTAVDTGLSGLHRVHLIGAGGSGMAPLAKLLRGLGHEVTGSDLKPGLRLASLGDIGIETWVGHDPTRALRSDLVVASSAVPDSDAELVAAGRAGIPRWRRPDLLGAITREMPAIGIAGTHGKTTSTALAVTVLRSLGRDPTFIAGGDLIELNTGGHFGERELFVLEADEAFGTFRRLHLLGLLVTNIEADHLDYYENVAALEEAFALVAGRVDGPVLGCIDDPGVRRLAERSALIGYGTSSDAVWRVGDVAPHGQGVGFTLTGPEGETSVTVPRPGHHVALDAAGVLALLSELGHPLQDAAEGLATFAGVHRRFEVLARIAGITVVDDYAHHPTEISATIAAGRSGGWQRVWAVFQPHRYTRTADLAPEFGGPLAAADHSIVTDVYSAGEAPLPGVSGKLVAEAVAAAGGSVDYIADISEVARSLQSRLRPGDLVLLLGAGDVNSIADDLVSGVEVVAP